MKILTVMFGNDGYAFAFRILEAVYSQDGCILILDDRMRRILIDRVRVRPNKFDEMLEAALELRLFDPEAFRDKKVITSPAIQAIAASVFRKREAERARYRRNHAAEIHPGTP